MFYLLEYYHYSTFGITKDTLTLALANRSLQRNVFFTIIFPHKKNQQKKKGRKEENGLKEISFSDLIGLDLFFPSFSDFPCNLCLFKKYFLRDFYGELRVVWDLWGLERNLLNWKIRLRGFLKINMSIRLSRP